MNPKARALAFVFSLGVGVGCGGTSAPLKADAGIAFDGLPWNVDATPKDVPTGVMDATTPDLGAATDVAAVDAASADTVPRDANGPPGAANKLIVAGSVQLIGSGPDSCTNQVPASGDRWCGFARPSTSLSTFELWVVNVTKAATGVTITCAPATPDANCLRLSTGLYSDPTNAFRIHLFDGDTLTYSEAPSSSQAGFIGSIFAWRPTWTAPRQISSSTGLGCSGHKSSRAAICIENAVIDAAQTFETAELHAGFLDDQTGPEHLPLVDTVILQTADDPAGVSKVAFRLSPDGQSVAWSTRADTTSTEDLRVQKVGDDTSRVKVASDVSKWTVSSDSLRWYWLQGYNYDATGAAPTGTLQSAPFPAGAAPTTISTLVGDYTELGSKGLAYRTRVTAGLGNLLVTPDRADPATVSTVDTGVFFVFEAAKDGKAVSYTKNVDFQSLGANFPLFDLFVASGTMRCTLAATPVAVLPPTFIGSSGTTAWGQFDAKTAGIDGFFATGAGCAPTKFAAGVISWQSIGDEGLVYLDTVNPDVNIDEASLRYGKLAAGALPTTGTVVQDRAGLAFASLLPSLPVVVYVLTTKTSADGLYVSGALPFTTTP